MDNCNLFGGIYYVNLDKRIDRKAEVEAEFEKIGMTAKRFQAIEKNPGIIGCGYSHLTIIKEAKSLGLKNVLIFEDDFEFLVDKETFWNLINSFFSSNEPYDVLMLSHGSTEAKPYNDIIQKIYSAQTTSGYIVNECFYDRLIKVWEENIVLLEKTMRHWDYSLDQCWKKLQGDNSNWYSFNVRIGKQRASYSDLGLGWMDYGV